MPVYRFQVRRSDGEDLGTVTYTYDPEIGDSIILAGNRNATVTAITAADTPLHGILKVTTDET